MNIVIMGAGKVGELLCRDLALENHNIVLIEKEEERLNKVLNHVDLNAILGNGASLDIQKEAQMDKADLYIAVTENDELNMIACVLAKKLGAKQTVARVRNPDYAKPSELMKNMMAINMLINPEKQAAQRIIRLLEFPQADSFECFASNKAPIVELRVSPNFKLVNKSLVEFRSHYKNVIVCAVSSQGEIQIPKGDHIIAANSHLFVIGPMDELEKLYKDNGQKHNKIKSIFIIGGGLIAQYLIEDFKHSNIKIKLVEINPDKAKIISRKYPHIDVILADGTNMEDLIEQGAKDYDALLALTGIDEENIIISMVAKSLGIKKTLTKINRRELIDIVDPIGLQSIITPKRIIADRILQYARALDNSQGSNVEALYRIADDKIEALQFKVNEKSSLTFQPIKDLKLDDNILIAYIIRKGKIIFPTGNDRVYPEDRVVLISTNIHLRDLDEIIL